ncbi:MAG: outer membrane beta-barrel protein [Candidatus Eisenbacteria bacterium]
MKKLFFIAVAILALGASTARAAGVGVGVFGGMSIPVLQDDQDKGSLMGLRVPVKLVPLLTIEPFYAKSGLGDKTIDVAGLSLTREGSDVTSYGANIMLTLGGPVSFYPFAGIGSAKFERAAQDESFTSYHLGLGMGFGVVPKLSIDLRGELQAAVDGDVSRKMLNVTLGASYSLFSMP